MKKIDAYRSFTSKPFRYIFLTLSLIILVMGLLIAYTSETAEDYGTGALLLIGFMSWLLIFADYFVLQGIAVRPQKGMNLMKSSFRGEELITGVIDVDLFLQIAISLIAVIGSLVLIIVHKQEFVLWDALFVASAWMTANIGITLTKLTERRFAKGLTSFMVIGYIGASTTTGLITVVGLLLSVKRNVNLAAGAVSLVLLLVLIFVVILMKKVCVKSYRVGFVDVYRKE